MSTKEAIEGLHPLERKVIPALKKYSDFENIVKESKLQSVEVMRAAQWLQNKGYVKISEEVREVVNLGENGQRYVKDGLPEKKFLKMLAHGEMSLEEITKKGGFDKNETNVCLGSLRRKAAVDVEKKGETLFVRILEQGKKLLEKEFLEEKFLEKKFPLDVKGLKDEERFSLESLRKRQDIVKVELVKEKQVKLTEEGRKLASENLGGEFIEAVTTQILKNKEWKEKKFRRYDVAINVPTITGGKKHFVNQSIEYIRNIWIELGFKEMKGTMVQTSFWDLDALFVPQDHPAREMQDTFYIKDPQKGKLPENWKKIKEVHENGGNTGSGGWGGKWEEEKAKENLLRTHTTVLSARTIAALKKEDVPAKFFSVGKVFRNEQLDYKHLFEFYQVEGIVVDPDANLKHLKGYLREFFTRMGFLDVRIRPAHFPYTEPSAEIEVLHPVHKEWIELGGAGIFRPEVTKTLIGTEVPVLAWGLGMGRIISEYWNIKDIRELDKNDLKQLREIKSWMR